MNAQTNWLQKSSASGRQAAESFNTSAAALDSLASHGNMDVRLAVAENQHTHHATVVMLAQDKNSDLRFALAENHNTSTDVLQILLDDDNPYVASRAKKTIARCTRELKIMMLPLTYLPLNTAKQQRGTVNNC